MEDDLTFKSLRRANGLRSEDAFNHPIDSWTPTDWATAMAGECGEVCNFVKKLRCIAPIPEVRVEIIKAIEYNKILCSLGKELADMIIYADLLAARLDIDLESVVRDKLNYVSKKHNSEVTI